MSTKTRKRPTPIKTTVKQFLGWVKNPPITPKLILIRYRQAPKKTRREFHRWVAKEYPA